MNKNLLSLVICLGFYSNVMHSVIQNTAESREDAIKARVALLNLEFEEAIKKQTAQAAIEEKRKEEEEKRDKKYREEKKTYDEMFRIATCKTLEKNLLELKVFEAFIKAHGIEKAYFYKCSKEEADSYIHYGDYSEFSENYDIYIKCGLVKDGCRISFSHETLKMIAREAYKKRCEDCVYNDEENELFDMQELLECEKKSLEKNLENYQCRK